MENLAQRLKKRGWNKKEIAEAAWLIKKTKDSIEPESSFFQQRVYRILLIVILVANFSISIAMMPLLIALKGLFLYFIIVVMGISFGLLFELVIRSIEHLERRHHLMLAYLIPIIALINIFAITKISNNIMEVLSLKNTQNPWAIGIVYAASFVLPYLIYRFVLKIEYYGKG